MTRASGRSVRSTRGWTKSVPAVALALVTACSEVPVQPEPAHIRSFIRLESDLGEYIGGGRSYEYTLANSRITFRLLGNNLRVQVQGDERWTADLQAPEGDSLRVGHYQGATRASFSRTLPGLSWNGEGRACGSVTGWFTIDSLALLSPNIVEAVDLQFEQHCEGSPAALRGKVRWRLDDPTVPAPVTPIPADLWKPDPAVVPASGNYLVMLGAPGEFLGQGQLGVFSSPAASVLVTTDWNRLTIRSGGWTGTIAAAQAPDVPLKEGYYPNVGGVLNNPARGAMGWQFNSRRCGDATGWFAVDRVSHVDGIVAAVELRFEQRCGGGTQPPLRGALRWSG